MKSILFYDDAVQFGGHEVLTLAAFEAMAASGGYRLGFMHYERNRLLAERLRRIAAGSTTVSLFPIPYHTTGLVSMHAIASLSAVSGIARSMASFAPDIVLVAQGRIEACWLGLLAARRAGPELVSCLPMAHAVAVAGRALGAGLRDRINRRLYRLPDRFITFSRAVADQLEGWGCGQQVAVVPTGIDLHRLTISDKATARTRTGLPQDRYLVGIAARVDFRQKGHDLLVEAVVSRPDLFQGSAVVVVGDGHDLHALKQMVAERGVADRFLFFPWQDEMSLFYSALDLLVMPSRYEGVPLVMLEALYCGLPIVAADIDGMAEYLPKDWLFPKNDALALAATVAAVRAADVEARFASLRQRVARECSRERFGEAFTRALVVNP